MTHGESIFEVKGGNLLECDMRLGRYGKLTGHGANGAWLRLQVLTHILKAVASPRE